VHGLGNLDEASNVATGNQAGKLALLGFDVLLGGLETSIEGILHDALETVVDLLLGPLDALAVLSHLKTRNGDTTTVGSLSGSVPKSLGTLLLAVSLKDVNGLGSAAHVGTLGDDESTSFQKGLGLLLADLVLSSARESNVNLANVDPRTGTLNPGELVLVLESSQGLVLDLESSNVVDLLRGERRTLLGDKSSLGVRQRDDGTTKLDDLESSVLGNVARARKSNALALEGAAVGVLKHVLDVVDKTVTGGLRSDQATTPRETLTSKDTLPAVAKLAVSTEEVTDLSATNTDITSGNVSLGANVLGQLSHESLAKSSDLSIGLALRVEVGTTLATTHAEASQGILEDLLETKELENRQVDAGVESETALVRTKGRVELDAVTTVDLEVTLVVFPDDTELDNTLRDGGNSKSSAVLGVLLEEGAVLEGRGEL
jgi:hypothetical protein